MTNVSRGAAMYDSRGRKLCSRCGQRLPAKGQRYCRPCFADYMREWRAGRGEMITVLLTRNEWEAVKEAREAAKTAGRHARRKEETL